MSNNETGGAGGNSRKEIKFSNNVNEQEYELPDITNLNDPEKGEVGHNVLHYYLDQTPFNRLKSSMRKPKKETKNVLRARATLEFYGTPMANINRMVKNHKKEVANRIALTSLIRRIEQNSGVTIRNPSELVSLLIRNRKIANNAERKMIISSTDKDIESILTKLRESNAHQKYAEEFATNVSAINANAVPNGVNSNEAAASVNRFMRNALRNRIGTIPNTMKRKYYTRKQGKYFGKGGVTFSNENNVQTYRLPKFNNLRNPMAPNYFAPNVNIAIRDYHEGILPLESLINAKGQSPGTATRRNGPMFARYRQSLINAGFSPENIAMRMQRYKNTFSRKSNISRDIRNVQERIGKTNYGNNNIGDPVTVAMEYNNVLPRPLINRLIEHNNNEVNMVQRGLSHRKGEQVLSEVFARIYSQLPVNNSNTDATIREKFMAAIAHLEPLSKELLLQKFNKIHYI